MVLKLYIFINISEWKDKGYICNLFWGGNIQYVNKTIKRFSSVFLFCIFALSKYKILAYVRFCVPVWGKTD